MGPVIFCFYVINEFEHYNNLVKRLTVVFVDSAFTYTRFSFAGLGSRCLAYSCSRSLRCSRLLSRLHWTRQWLHEAVPLGLCVSAAEMLPGLTEKASKRKADAQYSSGQSTLYTWTTARPPPLPVQEARDSRFFPNDGKPQIGSSTLPSFTTNPTCLEYS